MKLIPLILIKCFELFTLSLTIIVMKFAGIRENATETKKTINELDVWPALLSNSAVSGIAWFVNVIETDGYFIFRTWVKK